MRQASFDERPDLYSGKSASVPLEAMVSFRERVQDAQSYANRLFAQLSEIDYTIASLYYFQRLSQAQISKLLRVTQAAVSRRLVYIQRRTQALLKMPTSSPVRVREDFAVLFPPSLESFAFYIYFEPNQNRVKYFIETSQSGAANKINQTIRYLEDLVAVSDDDLSVDGLDRKLLAVFYLDFFRQTRQRSALFTYLFKRNDRVRAGAITTGVPFVE